MKWFRIWSEQKWNKHLFKAIQKGDLKEVQVSLDHGAQLEASYYDSGADEAFGGDGEGLTPLGFALFHEQQDIALWLLSQGAKVLTPKHNMWVDDPLSVIVEGQMWDFFPALLHHPQRHAIDPRDLANRHALNLLELGMTYSIENVIKSLEPAAFEVFESLAMEEQLQSMVQASSIKSSITKTRL